MRSLWTRIGLGAVGIFAIGMLLITLGRQAKAATQEAIASAVQHAARWTGEGAARADMPFRLNGHRIGRVQQVMVRRAEAGQVPEMRAVVLLTDPAGERALTDCLLEPEGGTQMDIERGFHCTASQGDRLSLGEIRFEPAGFSRRVVVDRQAEAELRQGDPFAVSADLGGKVQVEATGDEGKLVSFLADARGARLKVNDEFGRSLVRMLADSNGAMLNVRNEHGREVVKLQATRHGFSLVVDTAAAH